MEVLIVFVVMLVPVCIVVGVTWFFSVVEYKNRNIKRIHSHTDCLQHIRWYKWCGAMQHHCKHLTKYHKQPFNGQ